MRKHSECVSHKEVMSSGDKEAIDYALEELNSQSINNLFKVFQKVYTRKNLLLLDSGLSTLLNYLTPYLVLKEKANIEASTWINSNINEDLIQPFDGLIVICNESRENLSNIKELVRRISNKRIYVIVKELSNSFTYELNRELEGNLSFEQICNLDKDNLFISFRAKLKLYGWKANPVVVDSDSRLLSILHMQGGLYSYFNEPLSQLGGLSESFIKLIENSFKDPDIPFLKLNNIYGKGNHADLLIKIINDEKVPDLLSSKLSPLEQEFYLNKAKGNTDLIVLERNLDYISVMLDQTTYLGLIDDLFNVDIDSVPLGDQKVLLNDELYKEMKDLNFATVSVKLNKIANAIQNEYQSNTDLQDLELIKKLVGKLGSLNSRQDLLKRHTQISESVLNLLKNGSLENEPSMSNNIPDEKEKFLEFENNLFDLDYKSHLTYLKSFLHKNYDETIIFSAIIIISIANDGLDSRDLDWIYEEVFDNYGIQKVLTLNSLIAHNVIRVTETNALLQGAFSFFMNQENTEIDMEENEASSKIGISGGVFVNKAKYTLIEKFWNLHPEGDSERVVLSGLLIDQYPNPSFALPGNTVPLLVRLVEALYTRDFLEYKKVNNASRRPNWDRLGIDAMFRGKTVDMDLNDIAKKTETLVNQHSKYVFVIVIGGITRSELACFRHLEHRLKKLGLSKKIILLSSGIANRRNLLNTFST